MKILRFAGLIAGLVLSSLPSGAQYVAPYVFLQGTLTTASVSTAFRPSPKVTSAVVRLEPRLAPPVQVDDPKAFFGLVRAGFAAPRKQLRNSLAQGLAAPNAQVEECLAAAALDGRRRAETLSLDEWGRLYQTWTHRRADGSPRLR